MLRTRAWLLALSATVLLTACAQQRIREAAQMQFRSGDYESAVHTLEAGLKDYPDSALLRAGLVETRSQTLARIVSEAAGARAEGRLDDADKTLRRALALQPGNARVESLLTEIAVERRQRAALDEAETLVGQRQAGAALKVLAEALKSNPRHPELLALQRRLEMQQRQVQVKAVQAGLAESRPISLDFRDANLRTVLDVVSRNSGLNFVLDKDIRPDTRITIFLRSAKVEDALDLITSTYQLSKKVLDSQTILVYPNTPEKQREHQEQIVKVFYMASADAKGAAAFLKSMLKIRDPFVDERSNMLALRDSQENIQLAERLIALYDSSEPEVLLEVEVIEVNSTRLTDLGIKFPDTFSLTVLPPAGDTGLNLANVRGLTRDRIALAIGGATVNLKRETGDFNTLANPRIRVKNKEKAKVLIGDKVPVVSATVGTGGFVSDSVTYIDVGLKLDVEPSISIDDEVSIKVALEVSTLGSQIKTSSGTLAYQIGTRNASTLLRLHDGETQLLAGLISSQERSDASKVPGLGDLPVMGRLFASQRDDNQRTELVLSITPRILRNLRRPDANESELWVGTESAPRMRPVGGVRWVTEEAPAATSRASIPQPERREPQPEGRGVPQPEGRGESRLEQKGEPQASTGLALQWTGPAQVKAGDTFAVTLDVKTDQPLRGAPLQLAYSKDRLELLGIDEGDLLKQGEAQTSFAKKTDAAAGRASASVLRNAASGAIGQGSLLTLRLKALSAGPAEVSVLGIDPVSLGSSAPKPAALPAWRVQVQ